MESMNVHQNVWSRGGVSTSEKPKMKKGKAQKSSSTAISEGARSSYVLMDISLAAMDMAAVKDRKNQVISVGSSDNYKTN